MGVKKLALRFPDVFTSLQLPVRTGVPVSPVNRSTEGVPWQIVRVPPVPALGAAFTVAITVAVALVQGAVPVTVYV